MLIRLLFYRVCWGIIYVLSENVEKSNMCNEVCTLCVLSAVKTAPRQSQQPFIKIYGSKWLELDRPESVKWLFIEEWTSSRLCFWLSSKLVHKFGILHETKLINLLLSSICRACLCWFEHKKPLKNNNNFLSLCLSWIIAADLWRSPNVRAWWPPLT